MSYYEYFGTVDGLGYIFQLDEERKLEREVIQLTKTRWDSRKERLESELERKNEEVLMSLEFHWFNIYSCLNIPNYS